MRTKTLPTILTTFLSLAKSSIRDHDGANGIFPHILLYEKQDGTTAVCAMALQPEELYVAIRKIIETEKPVQIVYGMDRSNKEGQGIDIKYHSVLTIAYYSIGIWSIGAMPYSSQDEIGEVQWNNDWWNTCVKKELKTFNLVEPTPIDEVIGKAYQEKISVTAVHKTQMGTMYEGYINPEKLSDDVKNFLSSRSLDINDRNSVISVMKALTPKFDFSLEDHGFWTLHAGKTIFPARSSKTKVYLEGVEHIIEEINA